MHRIQNLYAICIIALFLLSSCAEEDIFNSNSEGDIFGYAYCFDEFGNQLEDFSGITVFTEPDRIYSTVTDPDGKYVLKEVKFGTYNLSFEKEGFATMKLFGIEHQEMQTNILSFYQGQAPFVYQNIKTQINNLYLVSNTLWASVSHPEQIKPDELSMRFYFSNEANFNPSAADAVQDIALFINGDSYCRNIITELDNLPFEPNETVYLKASIYTNIREVLLSNQHIILGLDTYFEPFKNIPIYPNMSTVSAEFSFMMP